MIASPLADHLPTARSCERWPQGKSRPRTLLGAGRSERKGCTHMELSDWDPRSVVVLILGVIVTAALFAATVYVFVQGER